MTGGNPWADPSTPTELGAPYPGPPPTGPPPGPYPGPYPWPYPGSPYGWHPYGWGYGPPWAPLPPPAPRRPGQVVAAAVLAFVQAALVLFASVYVFLLATVADVASGASLRLPGQLGRLATEARVVAVVQLVSAVALVVGGLLALHRRNRGSWLALLGVFGLQVALAVYWAVRVSAVVNDLPGSQTTGPLVTLSLFFVAAPLVGIGLLALGPGRRWFAAGDPGLQ